MLNFLDKFLLFLSFFPLVAFDFNSGQSGADVQLMILLLSLCSLCTFIFVTLKNDGLKGVQFSWWLSLYFLLASSFTALVMSVDFYSFISVLHPFIYIFLGFFSMSSANLSRRISSMIFVSLVIFFASITSQVFYIYSVVYVNNLSFIEARYHLVSPMISYIFSYGIVYFFLGNSNSYLYMLFLIFSMGSIFVSSTRGFLLAILVASIPFFYSLRMGAIKWVSLAVFGCTLLLVLVILFPDVSQNWMSRLFLNRQELGLDVTTYTRYAEYKGQMTALFSRPLTLLLGLGLGSIYEWDYSLLAWVKDVLQREQMAVSYAGHSLWVYSFYAGGILSGWVVPGVFLWSVYASARMFYSFRLGKDNNMLSRVSLVCAVAVFWMIPLSFTIYPLSIRSCCLVFGFICSVLSLGVKRLQNSDYA